MAHFIVAFHLLGHAKKATLLRVSQKTKPQATKSNK